jgi:hypothetical protein
MKIILHIFSDVYSPLQVTLEAAEEVVVEVAAVVVTAEPDVA